MSKQKDKERKKKPSPCVQFCKGELHLIAKYFNGATIDGIEHVTEGKSKVRRIVWALILLASLGVCLYFLIEHFINFAEKPTSTTINIVRPSEGLAFPAVTFCNLNPVSKAYAEDLNIESFLSFYLSSPEFFDANRNICEAIVKSSNLESTPLTFHEVFNRGAQELDDFVLSCRFTTNGSDYIDCKNSLAPVLTELGICYAFNYIVNTKEDTFLNLEGQNYGLRVTLNISQDDYLASLNSDAGVIVSVHERHTFPDPVVKGLSIPPNSHARIGISTERFVDKTNKGNCEDVENENSAFPGIRYSVSGCLLSNFYDYITDDDNCNCLEFRTPLLDSAYELERNCTLADSCCLARARTAVRQAPQCLPSCDQTRYNPIITYSKYPYNAISESIAAFSGASPDEIEDDLVSFSVFFTDLYVQYSETVVYYGPEQLVADIGGTLGLFLGASVITFMEIIILFHDELKGVCCASKKVRKGWDNMELKVLRRGSTAAQKENGDGNSSESDTAEKHKEQLISEDDGDDKVKKKGATTQTSTV